MKKTKKKDLAVKRSISMPESLWGRLEKMGAGKKGELSPLIQAAVVRFLDGVTDTDSAIQDMRVRLAALEAKVQP